jgi:flagellar biosynthesis chaperone FliJ
MKSSRQLHPARTVRERKDIVKQNSDQVLGACETAAARLKTAGEDLAASWKALCLEISTGVSSTDLLRKRAWCNVLELRLKEQAQALEQARHSLDAVWDDLMLTRRARELFNRLLKNNATETSASTESLPLLARTASAIAAAHRRSVQLKKQP